MARVDKIIAEYDLKLKEFDKDINKVKKGLKSTEKQGKKSAAGVSKSFNGLKSTFASLGVTIGAAFALRAITNFTKEAVRLYDIQAKQEEKLLTALKGREDVQQRLIKQAQALQKITLFGDEVTIQAQGVLAALGLTEEQIVSLIPLIQDMSIAMGIDFNSATSLVGKTVATSTDALARYFDTGLAGVIDQSERAIVLANSLSDAFKGQAEAAALVGSGPLTQIQNQLDDMKEEIGKKSIPSLIALKKVWLDILTAISNSKTILNESRELFNEQADAVEDSAEAIEGFSEAYVTWFNHTINEEEYLKSRHEAYLNYNKDSEKEIRNKNFLSKAIKTLTDEQNGETVSLARSAEITKEINRLQEELNTLLGKSTEKLEANTKAVKDNSSEWATAAQLALIRLENHNKEVDDATKEELEIKSKLDSDLGELSQLTFETEIQRLDRLTEINERRYKEDGLSFKLYMEYKSALSNQYAQLEIDNNIRILSSTSHLLTTAAGLAKKGSDFQKALVLANIVVQEIQAIAAANTLAMLSSKDWKEALVAGITLTASVVSVFAGLTAAIASSSSPDIPSFAKGVIDLKGGTKGKDSINADLMPGESVMTTNETSEHKDIFTAIRKKKLDSLIFSKYIKPERDYARSVLQNLNLRAELNDTRLHKDLKTGNRLSMINTDRLVKVLEPKKIR